MRGLSGSPVVTGRAPASFWELFFSLSWKLLNCPPNTHLRLRFGEGQMARPQVFQPDGAAEEFSKVLRASLADPGKPTEDEAHLSSWVRRDKDLQVSKAGGTCSHRLPPAELCWKWVGPGQTTLWPPAGLRALLMFSQGQWVWQDLLLCSLDC